MGTFPDFHSPFKKTFSESGERGQEVEVSGRECPDMLDGDPGMELDEVLPVSFSCTCKGFPIPGAPSERCLAPGVDGVWGAELELTEVVGETAS